MEEGRLDRRWTVKFCINTCSLARDQGLAQLRSVKLSSQLPLLFLLRRSHGKPYSKTSHRCVTGIKFDMK